jgi:hypothetical protein
MRFTEGVELDRYNWNKIPTRIFDLVTHVWHPSIAKYTGLISAYELVTSTQDTKASVLFLRPAIHR